MGSCGHGDLIFLESCIRIHRGEVENHTHAGDQEFEFSSFSNLDHVAFFLNHKSIVGHRDSKISYS